MFRGVEYESSPEVVYVLLDVTLDSILNREFLGWPRKGKVSQLLSRVRVYFHCAVLPSEERIIANTVLAKRTLLKLIL